MPHLALTTVGLLRAGHGDPQVQEFFDRLADTYGAAEQAEGFIGRSRLDPDTGAHTWGALVHPNFFVPDQYPRLAHTLSLWASLEAATAFAHAGVHGKALGQRLDWFVAPEWPSYAAWWVADTHRPDWREAVARLEHLHAFGATAFAFSFRSAFAPDGAAVVLDAALLRQIRARALAARDAAG